MAGMDEDFKSYLLDSKVKKETIDQLEKEELITVEDLAQASEELLKSCAITGGQVLRIKRACSEFCKPSTRALTPSSSQSSSGSSSPLSSASSSSATLPSSSASPSPQESSASPLESSPSPSPLPVFSKYAPCDSGTKGGSSWLVNFQLPSTFSPAVTEALSKKKLTGDRRNELTRDICSSIRIHTMFPTKAEREHVAFLLIKQYPFLEDAIGSGIGSWETAFKHRFKNLRKTGKKREEKSTVCAKPQRKDDRSQDRKRKLHFEEHYEMPEGETEETCKEHVKAMKKEMARTANRNVAMVKDLMEITHAYRREQFMKETVPISKFLEDYPALKTAFEIKAEFGRILGQQNSVKTMCQAFQCNWVQKITAFAETQPLAANIIASMKEAVADNPTQKKGIQEAAAVVLLPLLLKEKGGSPEQFIIICTDEDNLDQAIGETTSPRIIGSGEFWCLEPLCIAVEGKEVVTLGSKSMGNALGLLIACFYVFNMKYPLKCTNTFLFCETALMGNHQEAKKRMGVTKFLAALA